MAKAALQRRAKEARAWMLDQCFPLWSNEGVLPNGLFAELLDLDHSLKETEKTRVRVQARQSYVFVEAYRMGWNPDEALKRAEMGLKILSTHCLRPDGLAGRTLNTETLAFIDDTADLYDTAFVLFGLANIARINSLKDEALNAANEILEAVDAAMLDPQTGGYLETLPRGPKRHQNPHMHLLEACLALHAVEPDGRHLKRASEIIHLFEAHFTAGEGNLLAEFFVTDWSGSEGRDARIVEPGHQFEWVWLLHQYAKAANLPVSERSAGLLAFAQASLDEAGRAVQEVTREGEVEDGSRRTWPQTEALKAQLAAYESTGEDVYLDAACNTFDILMDEYLTPQGGWIDNYAADGAVLAQDMPASTGYHVVLAFSELIRVMGT